MAGQTRRAGSETTAQTQTKELITSRHEQIRYLTSLILLMMLLMAGCGLASDDDENKQQATIDALNATLDTYSQQDLDLATASALEMMTQVAQTEVPSPSPSPTATVTPSPTRIPSLSEYNGVSPDTEESPYLANSQYRLQEMSFPAWVQANLEAMKLDTEGALEQNRLFRWLYQPPTENGQPTGVHLGLYNPEYDELDPDTTGLNFQDATPQAIEAGANALRSAIRRVTLPSGEEVWALDVDQIEPGVGLVESNSNGDGLSRTLAKAEDLEHLQYIMVESLTGIILEADHRNGGHMTPEEALIEAGIISQNITNENWDQNQYGPLMILDDQGNPVPSGISIDTAPARTCRIEVAVDQQTANGDGDREDQKLELQQVPILETLEIEMPFLQLAANDQQVFALVVDMEAIVADWDLNGDNRELIQAHIQVELINLVGHPMTDIPTSYKLGEFLALYPEMSGQVLAHFEAMSYELCGVEAVVPQVPAPGEVPAGQPGEGQPEITPPGIEEKAPEGIPATPVPTNITGPQPTLEPTPFLPTPQATPPAF